MRRNGLTDKLRSGGRGCCGWVSTGDPYLAEVLGHAGFDAVVLDLQHGMFGLDRLPALLTAVSSTPATPMVRVPGLDAATIGKALDAGGYGVICPAVDSPAQARDFVAACRYPPLGTRSFGPARGLTYGGADYAASADRTITTWAMIESEQAVRQVDAIVETEGLDGVYVGPNDLALSAGLPVPTTGAFAPPLLAALGRVQERARAAGRWCGIFCGTEEQVAQARAMDWDLITPGNDMGLLRAEAARRISWVSG